MEMDGESMEMVLTLEVREAVREKDWDSVATIWKDYPELQLVTIKDPAGTGVTVLHQAVYYSDEETVEELVKLIDEEKMKAVTDERGNTPLHLAARKGENRMCSCIARWHPHLIGSRNNNGETPLFLAALHGQKHAFLIISGIRCLEEAGHRNEIYRHGRRNSDGSTVLHRAIDGEYFDLAFQIICRFPEFVDCVDERGRSPLYVLASKPTAFRSTSNLKWLHNIIYDFIPVENPKIEDIETLKLGADSGILTREGKGKDTSENYCKTTDVENPLSNAKQKKNPSPNCITTAWRFIKLCIRVLWRIKDLFISKQIKEMKEKHLRSSQILKRLVTCAFNSDYGSTGKEPTPAEEEVKHFIFDRLIAKQDNQEKKVSVVADQTPTSMAAKNGIIEIVELAINFRDFCPTINDVNSEGKNLMLVAVESRQPHVFQFLLSSDITNTLSLHVDNDGNNVLHLAAKVETSRPFIAPTALLQMQWEIKWYGFVKNKVPSLLSSHRNKQGMTPEETFMSTHKDLLKSDTEWLMKTSDSCTIVAALIATVAFATSASVPGGVSGNNGEPVFKNQSMFKDFAVSSLVALCFALTAVVMFLATLTSRHQAKDFRNDLPIKLLFGLTALFVSIASMLATFCGGHFFILKYVLEAPIAIEYLVAFLPVVVFGVAQCPLYYKLLKTMLKKVPERGYLDTT